MSFLHLKLFAIITILLLTLANLPYLHSPSPHTSLTSWQMHSNKERKIESTETTKFKFMAFVRNYTTHYWHVSRWNWVSWMNDGNWFAISYVQLAGFFVFFIFFFCEVDILPSIIYYSVSSAIEDWIDLLVNTCVLLAFPKTISMWFSQIEFMELSFSIIIFDLELSIQYHR